MLLSLAAVVMADSRIGICVAAGQHLDLLGSVLFSLASLV